MTSTQIQSVTSNPKARKTRIEVIYYYVRPYIGDLPLKKIDTGTIQALFNLLLDKKTGDVTAKRGEQTTGGRGLAPVTVKNMRKVLRAAFNYAVSQKLIAENPVSKTRLPQIEGSSANSMTIEEAKAFVSVKESFWYGYAFVFQLHTGLRPQELMALIWEDVDFERGTLRVERGCKWIRGICTYFGSPKCSRSERVISLAPQLLDLLRTHLEKQQKVIEERKAQGKPYGEPKLKEWVTWARHRQAHLYASARLIFPTPNGRVPNHTTPRHELKEMLQRAGVSSGRTNYRWYDLRHTHATVLLTLGFPEHEVAKRMGHSVHTQRVY